MFLTKYKRMSYCKPRLVTKMAMPPSLQSHRNVSGRGYIQQSIKIIQVILFALMGTLKLSNCTSTEQVSTVTRVPFPNTLEKLYMTQYCLF